MGLSAGARLGRVDLSLDVDNLFSWDCQSIRVRQSLHAPGPQSGDAAATAQRRALVWPSTDAGAGERASMEATR